MEMPQPLLENHPSWVPQQPSLRRETGLEVLEPFTHSLNKHSEALLCTQLTQNSQSLLTQVKVCQETGDTAPVPRTHPPLPEHPLCPHPLHPGRPS